jgi:hypothetical protein
VAGWLPPVVAVLVIAYFRSRRLFLALISVIIVSILANYASTYEATVGVASRTGTFLRPILWRANIELGMRSPLFGLGPAGTHTYAVSYRPPYLQDTYSRLGWRIMSEPLAHNDYIDTFTQTGLLGLGCLLWLLWSVARVGLALRPTFQGDFWQGFVHSCLGGVAAVAVACVMGSWFLPYVYNGAFTLIRHAYLSWLFFGALASLQRLAPAILDARR